MVREEDDFRISIAGAQEKTALLYLDDRWYLPLQRNADNPHYQAPYWQD